MPRHWGGVRSPSRFPLCERQGQGEQKLPLQGEQKLPLQGEQKLPLQDEQKLPLQSARQGPSDEFRYTGRSILFSDVLLWTQSLPSPGKFSHLYQLLLSYEAPNFPQSWVFPGLHLPGERQSLQAGESFPSASTTQEVSTWDRG